MKADSKRATQFLKGGSQRRERVVVTPEGVPLTVEIGDYSERVSAFFLDVLFWVGITIVLYTPLIFMVLILWPELHRVAGCQTVGQCDLAGRVLRSRWPTSPISSWPGRARRPASASCGCAWWIAAAAR